MPEKYFEKFQKFTYSNTYSVNLTQRTTVLKSVYSNPYVFYPYDIDNNERPDQISDRYYNDQYMSWLIYMANDIVDPYYQWYMDEESFETYLRKKYNVLTSDSLTQKIKHYRNNWYNGENISVSEFNALTDNQRKYWQPVYGASGNILSYTRDQTDTMLSTNKVVQYTINDTQEFIKDEIVKVYFNSTYSGKGQVCFSNSSVLTLQHMTGIVQDDNIGGYVYGSESQSNVVFTVSTVISDNIPATEVIYWDPVYIYDYEVEKNEQNKSIRVLDASFGPQAAKELKTLLK